MHAPEGDPRRPLRVALMNDYAMVVSGLRGMLEPFSDRVRVVESDSQLPVLSEVDVLLYDTYSRERVVGPVKDLPEQTDAPVVLFTWTLAQDVVREALDAGIAGCVSKTAAAEELVAALERIVAGETVVSADPGAEEPPAGGDWPGRDIGLTARESEVLALIAQGLTNSAIAERAYITQNTLKSRIRSLYRKIGVTRRSEAIVWANDRGFRPDSLRTIAPS